MHIEISNYRGIELAHIDLNKVVLVGGKNRAGKSSVAQAFAAALTRKEIPISGIQKQHASKMVKDGNDGGEVIVSDGDNSIKIKWPKCDAKIEGNPPMSSMYAAGTKWFTDMDSKEVAKELGGLIGAEPTKEDLAKYLKSKGVEVDMDALWGKINGLGWDGQHKRTKDIGTKLKGTWEHITGERYGTAKSENWTPKGWTIDLDKTSEEDLQKQLNDAKKELEGNIHKGGVDQGVAEQWVNQLPKIQKDISERKERLSGVLKNIEQIKESIAKIPHSAMKCPNCSVNLVENNKGVLEVIEGDTFISVSERKGIIDELGKGLDVAAKEQFKLQGEIRVLEENESKAKESQVILKNLKKVSNTARKECSEKIDIITNKINMLISRREANDTGYNLKINAIIVGALEPAGLRKIKLCEALSTFNAKLQEVSAISGWPATVITDSMEIMHNGFPLKLCSESEMFRARTNIQLVVSQMDKSKGVIIDGADILDKEGRNGLLRAVLHTGIPSMICMTINTKEDLPDMSVIEGKSYWISDNKTEVLNA